MKKRIIGLVTAAVLSIAALSGCQSAPAPAPENEGENAAASGDSTVVIGMASDLKTLDTAHMYEVFANMISYATYDMPFRIIGEDIKNPQPSLVTADWTLDETSTVYTFPIREDVVFQSGNKMTSKDFVFSINRAINLKSNTYPHVENIEKIEAPDDYTVVMTLKKPDASFLTKLASNAFCILDSELVIANGGSAEEDAALSDTATEFLDKNTAGSGAYKLISWTPNVEVVLEKNPEYWGEAGNVEKYILKEIPDANTQIQMLERGEIDIALNLNADNISQVEGKDGILILGSQSAISTFLLMNEDEAIGGPVSNAKVQQAIRYAIDYEGLLMLAGEGATLPLNIVPQGFIGAKNKPEGYRDVEKAKALMAEAGFADGFDIVLTAANFDTEGLSWVTIAQKLQADLAEINVRVKVETGEIGVVIDAYRQGTVPFLLMHWSPDYYDINNQLAFIPGDVVAQRANWAEDANPALNELAQKIVGESDAELRAQYSQELQDLLAEDSPYAFLLQHPKFYAISDRLSNVSYTDLTKIQLNEISVN